VKTFSILPVIVCLCICQLSFSQEQDKSATISLFTGAMNYQGDLNPNSFTFKNSNFAAGLTIRKPLNRWFTLRGGINIGKIEAADRNNRDYLKQRNLSFYSSIKEAYLGLEVTILDMSAGRFTPYIYGGIAVFQFNPWTNDKNGVKTYLKPLSTEGQGLPQYPEQKEYNLTQLSLPLGAGVRFAVSDNFSIGIEFNQRKSFTDYIDDVSSNYVDVNILRQAKGNKAVELAFRENEIPQGRLLYPAHGEQRGTPSEMDWYYFFGLTSEIKLNAFSNLFGNGSNKKGIASQRCPRNVIGY
jgi:opacity protein-like surface antigen